MQKRTKRLKIHPLAVMLLLSGGLHLLLLGAAAEDRVSKAAGFRELQLSLQAAPAAAAPVAVEAAQSAVHPERVVPGEPRPESPAVPAQPRTRAHPDKDSRTKPKLAERAPADTAPPSRPRPPVEPKPDAPQPQPQPGPAPRDEPGPEPETEEPFEELVTDQREEVASARSGTPVEREPQWRQPPHPPAYPPLARRRGQEGEVMLRLDIDPRGEVVAARVLASSGFPLLDRAAQEAGRDWQLVPARINGIAVASYVTIPVQFHLH